MPVKLSSLDLSKNIALTQLDLAHTDVKNLDITNNINLKHIFLGYNNIPSVDFSENILLENLLFDQMPLVELDVTKNINLLWIQGNIKIDSPIRNIDLSKNLKLYYASFSSTPIETLDLSNNIALTQLRVSGLKNLKSLNLKNGNNKNMPDPFIATTPLLRCVQVDDPVWSRDNWRQYEPPHYYSTDCGD